MMNLAAQGPVISVAGSTRQGTELSWSGRMPA